VENNRESTDRQYALVNKATELGWAAERVVVIDEDLGLSGSGDVARSGFARLTAEAVLGHIGLVLGLEVSRLARNNADRHRLIELAGLSNTLIGNADGIYHPALSNDRLLLGLTGTMSEAELYVIRARLNGGIRNKAERGELRRGLPVGFVYGEEEEGEVRFHPDEAVVTAIRNIFDRNRLAASRVAVICATAANSTGSMCSPPPSMPMPTPMAKTRKETMRPQPLLPTSARHNFVLLAQL